MRIVPGQIVGVSDGEYLIAFEPGNPRSWGRTFNVPTGRLGAARPIGVWMKFIDFASERVDLFPEEAEAILAEARRTPDVESPVDLGLAPPQIDIRG